MTTAKISYAGSLRTTIEHTLSGKVIQTDAPKDNHGLGRNFSPTDLMSVSLASCMLTVMAIKAGKLNIRFDNVSAEVTKVMNSLPRKVKRIIIRINMPDLDCNDEVKQLLEKEALNCPVALSLSEQLEKDIRFSYR